MPSLNDSFVLLSWYYFTWNIHHFDISLSYAHNRGIQPNKFEEHVQHCYDVPHPSSSSFEYIRESTDIPQDQSLLIHEQDLHSYPTSSDGNIKFHNYKVSSSRVTSQRKRRKGGFSSFFIPDRNNSRRAVHSRSGSNRRHESFSNERKSASRSQSIDSIGHLQKALPRNSHIMRYNTEDVDRRTNYKRKSFTGSLNSLLDGQSSHPTSRRTSQRRTIQSEDKRNLRNHRKSPHQSPQRRNRTRSNSRERSFASSLDSLFMTNSFHHNSPKHNRRSRRGDFFNENKHKFGWVVMKTVSHK